VKQELIIYKWLGNNRY